MQIHSESLKRSKTRRWYGDHLRQRAIIISKHVHAKRRPWSFGRNTISLHLGKDGWGFIESFEWMLLERKASPNLWSVWDINRIITVLAQHGERNFYYNIFRESHTYCWETCTKTTTSRWSKKVWIHQLGNIDI